MSLSGCAPAIEIQGLFKNYRSGLRKQPVAAVSDVSLTVAAGEAFGFVGPNGAGKSTTIKILTGSIFADSGFVALNGFLVSDAESRRGLGYVPENPYLYDYLTPLETLRMGCSLYGVKADNISKHCIYWLDRFDVARVKDKRIRSFSKGMTQRTALAYALAMQPKVLILDEPLSGLDPIGRKDVVDILMDYRKQGGTIFFSSHVLHDVERLADRFGLIHKGKLRTVQSPNELLGENSTLVIRSVGAVPVAGMTLDVGNRWFAEVAADKVWPTLNLLEQAGHRVLEVKPSLTLEQAFLKYTQAD